MRHKLKDQDKKVDLSVTINKDLFNLLGSKSKEIGVEQNIFIQHAMNLGEFYIKELGYWLDGYDKENNIVYEWDEHRHFLKGKLREKDLIRQTEIEKFLKCKFIRINEREYNRKNE